MESRIDRLQAPRVPRVITIPRVIVYKLASRVLLRIMDAAHVLVIAFDESEDESEDEGIPLPIMILLGDQAIRRENVPKVQGFVENTLPNYTDVDFRADFRSRSIHVIY